MVGKEERFFIFTIFNSSLSTSRVDVPHMHLCLRLAECTIAVLRWQIHGGCRDKRKRRTKKLKGFLFPVNRAEPGLRNYEK